MSTATAPPDAWPHEAVRLPSLARLIDHRWAALLLLPWCGFLFFYGLNAGDLYRTEALRAIVAQDFLNSGNWVVPTLYGEPLLTKPPGAYAAIAAVSWPLGGVSDASARLPSALAATATVLLFFWYFCRLFGTRGGLVAGFIVPASVMWLDKASAAEIDMLQVFWVAGSVLFALRALEAEEAVAKPQAAFRWWLAALLCVAGGVLTKWTAPAFFYLTLIPLLWWRGQLRLLWGCHHLLAAGVAAALCFGWAALVVRQVGWEVLLKTVTQEALQRLLPHEIHVAELPHHHRPYPWGEALAHPFVVLASTGPWSFFALVTLWPGFAKLWDEPVRRLLQALHCWTWPNLLFWSAVPEHAPRHSFPLFPALAGLGALVWLAWLSGRLRWRLPRIGPAALLTGLLVAWLVVKLGFVHVWVPIRDGRGNSLLLEYGLRPRPLRDPRRKAEEIAARIPADQPLYLFRFKDEGIMFYYGHCHAAGQPERVVRRLARQADLPSNAELVYCIIAADDRPKCYRLDRHEWFVQLPDQQGDPFEVFAVRGTNE
jgi:4-amino-4-deoxy-L-arabinose transferase-like glycosyltransferase